jgi:hypothetical protein
MGDLEPVVIDINSNDIKSVVNLNSNDNDRDNSMGRPPVNFGGGLEFLMNDKKKGSSADIGLGELSDLENELNDLSTDISTKTLENSRSGLFNSAINSMGNQKVSFNETNSNSIGGLEDLDKKTANISSGPSINLGEQTSQGFTGNKSWDGLGKYNNMPIPSDEPQLAKEELVREKFKFLRRLEDLERKGASLTKKYTMESPLAELQGEYEMIIAEKEKSNSVKFQGRMLMAAVTGLEFLNAKVDPFDLKMEGWAEQVNENVTDYDEIFAELHDKYKSKAKMAPELKLLFQLGGSAIMVHMTNTMFKSSMPGMDDIMKQNPELMQQFTQAAVNSMGDTNPGFGNFMNNFMPGSNGTPAPPPNMGAPPPSVNTQANKTQRYAPPANRPDLTASKTQAGISIEEKFSSLGDNSIIRTPAPSTRPEMKGPGDISQLLSGLKTKQVNIPASNIAHEKDPSTVSIADLKELNDQKMPRSNRKKSGSSKNTISLDL